jgi:hypothetical protein
VKPRENTPNGNVVPATTLQGLDVHAPADHEPSPLPWCTDPVEHFATNWESAWIDLGGEG